MDNWFFKKIAVMMLYEFEFSHNLYMSVEKIGTP